MRKRYPKGFKPGDAVAKDMGIRMSGTVSVPFHWKDSTDGTYKAPEEGYIPISWDNGTCGYCHVSHLV